MSASKRRKTKRVEPTHEWERLVPLFEWPKQENYEVILFALLRFLISLGASLDCCGC